MGQSKNIAILVCEPMAKEGLDLLASEPSFVIDSLNLTRAELLAKISSYDALLVRSQTAVDKELIEAGLRLRFIGRAGVGLDNIDITSAKMRGIAVANTPSGNTIAAAELAFGLMLGVARKIFWASSHLKEGRWTRSEFVGCELAHKTLGLLGFGNVGKSLAKRAQAFDMNILALDPQLTADDFAKHGVKEATIEELLSHSDFLSLHCPLNNSTKNIIDHKNLSLMKPGVILINTARGELIDDQALIEALDRGQVSYAALDVFKKEPPMLSDPLISHPRVISTPHLGASTKEAQIKVSTMLAEQVISFFNEYPE